MNSTDVPIVVESMIVRDEDRVAFNSETSEIYEFNEMGFDIFNLCDGAKQVGQIVSQISQKYGIEEEQCRNQVLHFLDDLCESGLMKG